MQELDDETPAFPANAYVRRVPDDDARARRQPDLDSQPRIAGDPLIGEIEGPVFSTSRSAVGAVVGLRLTILAAVVWCVCGALAAVAPSAWAAGIGPGTRFTVFSASLLTHPAPVAGTDGYVHLSYELVLTNTTPFTFRIGSLEVRNARTGRVLLRLAGGALEHDVSPVGGPEANESRARVAHADPAAPARTRTVASSRTVIVWLDVRLRRRADVPAVLDHRVVGSFLHPPQGAPSSMTDVLARVATVRHDPVALGPPVGPGIWYASEACCTADNHHHRGLASINGQLLVPQRFAIDWFALNSQHDAWVGSPHRLESYLTYRQPAIAAASGTVADAQDGLPNNPDVPKPPAIPPIQDTVGNHVVLKIAPGVFLLYGHLDPRSVRVHVGQRVRRGQVLGLLGTSGNSTTPHLHFQVMTTPTFFPTDSPPFVFDKFTLLGQVTKRIWDDNLGLQPTGRLPFTPARRPTVRRREMPLDRNVIEFGRRR